MGTFQELNLVSVIIPTLNAAADLAGLLAELKTSTIVDEVVVVDGGSVDDSVSIARAARARVIVVSRGRGTQLAAGAAAAIGRWLLFLHADCRLEAGWEVAVRAFLAAPDARRRAGYFDFALDDVAPGARRLERIVAWRCRVLGLPYGDQGLLISRNLYDEIGGFAPLPLMEDVDLVRRLGRKRLARIPRRCVTSARRHRSEGYLRRSARNLLCLLLYLAGVPPDRIVRFYG